MKSYLPETKYSAKIKLKGLINIEYLLQLKIPQDAAENVRKNPDFARSCSCFFNIWQ